MISQTKEEYLKETVTNSLEQVVRLGKSLGFSKEQVLKLYQEAVN